MHRSGRLRKTGHCLLTGENSKADPENGRDTHHARFLHLTRSWNIAFEAAH